MKTSAPLARRAYPSTIPYSKAGYLQLHYPVSVVRFREITVYLLHGSYRRGAGWDDVHGEFISAGSAPLSSAAARAAQPASATLV